MSVSYRTIINFFFQEVVCYVWSDLWFGICVATLQVFFRADVVVTASLIAAQLLRLRHISTKKNYLKTCTICPDKEGHCAKVVNIRQFATDAIPRVRAS